MDQQDKNQLQLKRDGLLKIKRILLYIRQRKEIAPRDQVNFNIKWTDFFEAGRGLVKNQSEVESILKKASLEGGGIRYRWITLTDHVAPLDHFSIQIIDNVAFENYLKWVADEYEDVEPSFQKLKAGSKKKQSIVYSHNSIDPRSIYSIFRPKTRELIINDRILSRPNFDSENDKFCEYVFAHPDQKHTKKDIESGMRTTLKKSLHQIIDDLGFTKELKKLFFPGISSAGVEFRTKIDTQNLRSLNINEEIINSFLKGLPEWKHTD
ncbi:MAG: hypothetical protein WCT08_00790 [Patescibacteria group bacterium]|jgi:hypothetical protein